MIRVSYAVRYKKSVEKDLRKISTTQLKPIVAKIRSLAVNPRPSGAVKLRGASNLFRVRYADYRIVYRIHDGELLIMIVKVGHRREVYRDF